MTTPTSPAGLRVLLAEATKGPWELQDGSSWRRIGNREGDGNVLCPYNARSDNHPDLTAGRGEDLYANLRLIVALVNNAEQLIGAAERVEELEAALRKSAEGWSNAIELRLLPPQHVTAATILRDEARQALGAQDAG